MNEYFEAKQQELLDIIYEIALTPNKSDQKMLGFIENSDDDFIRQAHTICDSRAGYNLASLAVSQGHSWVSPAKSCIPMLAQRGFDLAYPDKAGRIPALGALENATCLIEIVDLELAFKNGLDPLLIDVHNGCLLSIDFNTEKDSELSKFIFSKVEGALLGLSDSDRHEKIERMRTWAHPIYIERLVNLEANALNDRTPQSPIDYKKSPRI